MESKMMSKKAAIESDTLIYLIIGAVVFIVLVASSIMMKDRLLAIIDSLKGFLR